MGTEPAAAILPGTERCRGKRVKALPVVLKQGACSSAILKSMRILGCRRCALDYSPVSRSISRRKNNTASSEPCLSFPSGSIAKPNPAKHWRKDASMILYGRLANTVSTPSARILPQHTALGLLAKMQAIIESRLSLKVAVPRRH